MDTRKICLTLVLIVAGFATAHAQNSVAGRVVDKRTGEPISEVNIFIIPLGGNPVTADRTRKDGLYVLSVPKSIGKYVIRFRLRPQYFDGMDCGDEDQCIGIANTSPQLKRPDMELTAYSGASGMSAEQLKALIDRQNKLIRFGDATKTPGIREMGMENLYLIKSVNDQSMKFERESLDERFKIDKELDVATQQTGATSTGATAPRKKP